MYEHEESKLTKKEVITQKVVSNTTKCLVVDINGIKYELVKLGYVKSLEDEISSLKTDLQFTTNKLNALVRLVNNISASLGQRSTKQRY
jgi:uncharacterized protein YoxC